MWLYNVTIHPESGEFTIESPDSNLHSDPFEATSHTEPAQRSQSFYTIHDQPKQ